MTDGAVDPIAVKLGHLFGASDTDGDGLVDWNDYERLISRYLDGYGIAAEDDRAHALRAAYQRYWSELLRHVNGVDRLSKEQFVAGNKAAGADTSQFTMASVVPQAIFDVMDTDGDDAISKPEYKVFLEAWGVSDLEALNVFLELDTDDDGRISRDEFIGAIRDFFTSPELDSPASLFFGHIER
ncbi:EF-hand domain-containing protein [Paractinoplanes brasiliensis]|uniref:EF hand domain-containing protein n=1 Tax=Paractinoplanes brasiliensis TaxID=52695 RepID=A0A4R6K0B3_9ACTN|nr:EF-hand domain-containing protein [Actinoplanes brasiliensis]TDO42610.1 EF hand domain-containing protein [Actinoplanes brasiliensis]GID31287.1 calcium-binding protein [Actinoplanes brasiliensis]